MENKDPAPKAQNEQDAIEVALTEETNAGVIKVSHEVVASIVRIAVLGVPGVVSIGSGGFREEFVGLFNKRDATPGINVVEDEAKNYVVSVKVVLRFGVELAKVGEDIQVAVREQVTKMTSKKVARVDVSIDGIRMDAEKEDRAKNIL